MSEASENTITPSAADQYLEPKGGTNRIQPGDTDSDTSSSTTLLELEPLHFSTPETASDTSDDDLPPFFERRDLYSEDDLILSPSRRDEPLLFVPPTHRLENMMAPRDDGVYQLKPKQWWAVKFSSFSQVAHGPLREKDIEMFPKEQRLVRKRVATRPNTCHLHVEPQNDCWTCPPLIPAGLTYISAPKMSKISDEKEEEIWD